MKLYEDGALLLIAGWQLRVSLAFLVSSDHLHVAALPFSFSIVSDSLSFSFSPSLYQNFPTFFCSFSFSSCSLMLCNSLLCF